MVLPSKNSILFNGGAALIILLGAGALVKAVVMPDELEPCTERYFRGTVLEFGRDDGTPASPGQMQSRLGVKEWGVLDNLAIEQVNGQPQSLAMRISLSKVVNTSRPDAGQLNGVGFNWKPGFPHEQQSACLTYKLWIPADFKYSQGGYLPGLYGGSLRDDADVSDKFSTQFHWTRNGKGGIRLENQPTNTNNAFGFDAGEFDLPKGKWITLEQEIALNTAGVENGSLHVWIDGDLVLSESGKNFRTKPGSRILGVFADTHYRRLRGNRQGPKAQSVLMTPFELRWQ